jgi:hypothetical protein
VVSIEDNFLNPKEFVEWQAFFMSQQLTWHFNESVVFAETDVDKFQFFHMFYKKFVPVSPFMKIIDPILNKINPISLWRVKANLLTRTPEIDESEFHVDMADLEDSPERLKEWTTSIFYVNTNNGYTKFEDDTKVESVANRLATFPSTLKHHGSSCTDEKRRMVINFNYFK